MTRVVFMGSPEFAVPSLQALIDSGMKPIAVYTQSPKPKNRGQSLTKTPIHTLAETNNIPVYTPLTLRNDEVINEFSKLQADIVIVVAYGFILPKAILESPKFGCINIHASLLPRWHGAAPIQRAIEAGDSKTGVTIMKMDEGLDSGDMLKSVEVSINDSDTASDIHDQLSLAGSNILVDTINEYMSGSLSGTKQDQKLVTYAKKITKEETLIDFNQPCEVVSRKIRAFSPFPGAFFYHNQQRIKILNCHTLNNIPEPKDKDTIYLKCQSGYLVPTLLQREGKQKMQASEFLRGLNDKDIPTV